MHNVGLASSQILLKRLREVLIEKRRKSYTITVGRLNPAKLGNFEVVECWVMIGCREGGLVDGKVRVLKPSYVTLSNQVMSHVGLLSTYHNAIRVAAGSGW